MPLSAVADREDEEVLLLRVDDTCQLPRQAELVEVRELAMRQMLTDGNLTIAVTRGPGDAPAVPGETARSRVCPAGMHAADAQVPAAPGFPAAHEIEFRVRCHRRVRHRSLLSNGSALPRA